MSLKDDIKVPVKCPGCSAVTKKSLGDLNRDPVVICSCGASIKVNVTGDAAGALDELDAALKGVGAKRVR